MDTSSLMTERAFLESLENLSIEQTAYVRHRLAKIDEQNEKRRNTPKKGQEQNEAIASAILDLLTDTPMLSVEVQTHLVEQFPTLSVPKVNGIAKLLADEGRIVKVKQKVKGKGEQTAYRLPEAEPEAEPMEVEG